MSVRVIVNFNAKSNMLAEFASLLNGVKTDLPKVRGCQGVNVYRSLSDSSMFTLVERWDTKKLHQDHLARLAEDGTWELLSSHLSADPQSDYYEQL